MYTDEKNILLLIALLKLHGIRKIIVSPGAMNITFVGSIQKDSFFEIYSVVDERSAAYMACGLAAESGEPVVLSCTGATASRNYISGLTEAYYRKLPVLAITSAPHIGQIGQNIPQVIDRTQIQKDIAKISLHIPSIYTEEDCWNCELKINEALECIFEVLRKCNKYIDDTTPWVLAKDEESLDRLETVIYNLLDSIRVCSILLQAFIPTTSEKIFAGLKLEKTTFESIDKKVNTYKLGLEKPANLFERIKED